MAEICDGKDNDCDNKIDEGLTFDQDGDGYTAKNSCSGLKNDCDDTKEYVFPEQMKFVTGWITTAMTLCPQKKLTVMEMV